MSNQNLTRKTKHSPSKVIRYGIALSAIFIVSLIFGVVFFVGVRQLTVKNMQAYYQNGGIPPEFANGQNGGSSAVDGINPTFGVGDNSSAPASTLTPWDGVGRVTVLVMGLDYRDWQANEKYSRSDSMILLTLDPLNLQAGILSVPRDLWASIPGFKNGRINTAYYLGDAYKLPGGGPGLAVKTVEQLLGVPINFYAVVDFQAFIKFIDDIGGLKIDIPAPITIELLGGGTKKLKAGVQVLPGLWALGYARNRYTAEGDFDRAKRQQQVIMGIRDRILDFNLLPVLVQKGPQLYQELASGVHTNLTLDQVFKLAVVASKVKKENIRQGVIDKTCVLFANTTDNQAILIPIPDKIRALRDNVFASSGALGPMTTGDAKQQMQAEQPKVSIQNGSNVSDLGQKVAQSLQPLGVNITSVGNTGSQVTVTSLIVHSGKVHTLAFLANWLKVSSAKIKLEYSSGAPVDIEVILGSDATSVNLSP